MTENMLQNTSLASYRWRSEAVSLPIVHHYLCVPPMVQVPRCVLWIGPWIATLCGLPLFITVNGGWQFFPKWRHQREDAMQGHPEVSISMSSDIMHCNCLKGRGVEREGHPGQSDPILAAARAWPVGRPLLWMLEGSEGSHLCDTDQFSSWIQSEGGTLAGLFTSLSSSDPDSSDGGASHPQADCHRRCLSYEKPSIQHMSEKAV